MGGVSSSRCVRLWYRDICEEGLCLCLLFASLDKSVVFFLDTSCTAFVSRFDTMQEYNLLFPVGLFPIFTLWRYVYYILQKKI